jgi:hypothetical protein
MVAAWWMIGSRSTLKRRAASEPIAACLRVENTSLFEQFFPGGSLAAPGIRGLSWVVHFCTRKDLSPSRAPF